MYVPRKFGRIAIAFVTVAGTLSGVSAADATQTAPGDPVVRITRFLGEQRLPHKMQVKGTTLGGLSGMDRDPHSNTWYFISDDRWRYEPARFYTGRLIFHPS